MEDENAPSDVPVIFTPGVTLANDSEIARARSSSLAAITPEVKLTLSGGCETLSVSDAPLAAPNTVSLKEPDRKLVPVPPAPLVMEKVPLKFCVTLPETVVAGAVLVAERFRKALNGVAIPASICVTVIATFVPVMVDVVPLVVPVIVLVLPVCPKVRIVVALAVAASKTTVQSRSNRFVMAILRLAWGSRPAAGGHANLPSLSVAVMLPNGY